MRRNTFRLESKNLFLTYPKCDLSKEDIINELRRKLGENLKNYVVAEENHESGEPHRHVYLNLSNQIRTRDSRYFDIRGYHGNYQGCRGVSAVIRYCTKESDYTANFDISKYTSKPPNREEIGRELLEGKKVSELVIKYPKLLFGYKRLCDDIAKFRSDIGMRREITNVRGTWIYGPPGIGKSRKARTEFPKPIFIKQQNKWWDGYSGEESVLIDDFDKMGSGLSHYLKIWADRYECYGEVKGSTVYLNHLHIIITSNYSIEEIWSDDLVLCEAIRRRFKVIYMSSLHEELGVITYDKY